MRRFAIAAGCWLVAATLAALLAPPVSAREAGQTVVPEERLAAKYAPVIYLVAQDAPCAKRGDAYFPAPVEIVLGNRRIVLIEDAPPEVVATAGPTAGDLFRRGEDDHLDYPGNPRRPGCTYDRDFKALLPQPTVTYAHVAIEEERPGLALQYWFFYYFNDADNTHEGDWEMIQLRWDVSTVEEALATEPVAVAYAQHNGGETADWTDAKLRKENGRPVVFSADGSHASHYDDDVFLGFGENGTGLGCDDAAGPHTRYELTPILVPTSVDDQDSPLAWLTFEGRWGERQGSIWNGPTGPNTKPKWRAPLTWADDLRGSSISVGEANSGGLDPINVFCTLVSAGGSFVNLDATHPWLARALLGVAFLAILFLVGASWRTLLRTTWLYLRHPRTFALIGWVLIPLGLLLNLILFGLSRFGPLEIILRLTERSPGTWLIYTLSATSLVQLPALLLLGPAVTEAVEAARAGRPIGARPAYRAALRRLPSVASAVVPAWLLVIALIVSIVGIPWAIVRIVRWAFITPAIVLDGAGTPRQAWNRSAAASRGRALRTGATLLLLGLLAIFAPVVIGLLLLVAVEVSPAWVSTLAGLIGATTIPYAFVGIAVLYRQLAPEPSADGS